MACLEFQVEDNVVVANEFKSWIIERRMEGSVHTTVARLVYCEFGQCVEVPCITMLSTDGHNT